uniref:Ovule protein n=1 Tax=Angiostrongylus cantonensis TaxID=6313 RepID=A0A0K0CWY5_ANGCA
MTFVDIMLKQSIIIMGIKGGKERRMRLGLLGPSKLGGPMTKYSSILIHLVRSSSFITKKAMSIQTIISHQDNVMQFGQSVTQAESCWYRGGRSPPNA